ncbi:MAG: hypothetical protein F4X64_16680 [Chloroflexi bacterium]|nr:hypothetical protein [Chloroflexota bacterium]
MNVTDGRRREHPDLKVIAAAAQAAAQAGTEAARRGEPARHHRIREWVGQHRYGYRNRIGVRDSHGRDDNVCRR